MAKKIKEIVISKGNGNTRIIKASLSNSSKSNSATIVIATESSLNKQNADYVCTGTNDNIIISAAINSLDNGGKAILLEGTYNISDPITITASNVTIEGIGNGTIFKRMFSPSTTPEPVIDLLSGQGGCILKDFQIDGNKSAMSNNSYAWAIIAEEQLSVNNAFNLISNISIINSGCGINVDTTWRTKIDNCRFEGIDNQAIYLNDGSKHCVINNNIYDCNTGIFTANSGYNDITNNRIGKCSLYGAYIADGSDYTRLTNNYFYTDDSTNYPTNIYGDCTNIQVSYNSHANTEVYVESTKYTTIARNPNVLIPPITEDEWNAIIESWNNT